MRKINKCNVCVIGGAGFLGSQLVDYLINERKCNVLVLDNLITGLKKHIHDKAEFIWFDIRDDETQLSKLLLKHEIDYVFNYAAEPYIPECFERPMHFFDINATSVLRVLNACQQSKIKGLLQVSSAEIYGDLKGKIKESDPVSPHSTYGVSKVAADGLVQVRWREANVPAIASNKIKLGNNSFRDFQYSVDAVKMAVELLENGQFGEVYNMGSETGIQIYDLALLIGKLMGRDNIEIETESERIRPWEIWHLQSDNTKLYSAIGKKIPTDLTVALKETIKYFQNNNCKWDW
jgi:nucleoside-diphosphate-sugar epimerase